MKVQQPLSEGIAKIIEINKDTLDNFLNLSVDDMRKTLASMYVYTTPKVHINTIRDLSVKHEGLKVPIRLYSNELGVNLPILVYFHGGGWVLGDLEAQDRFCRYVASKHDCVVISVDYRLAPENKYPAAIEDGLAVLEWITKQEEFPKMNIDQIVLAGDSAGGNLSAVIGKQFNKKKIQGRIVQSVMIYPVTDLTNFERYSYNAFGKGYMLDKDEMIWYRDMYLENNDQANLPEVSPLLDSDFSEYPPLVVVTAGYDVLRDEGVEFHKKAYKHKHDAQLFEFDNLTHSFLRFGEFDENARIAVDKIVEIIGSKWN